MKRIITPWCASDISVLEEDFDELSKISKSCEGSCPSGPTYNMQKFRREAEKVRDGYEWKSHGGVAELPWGNVSDSVSFTPSQGIASA